MHLHQVIPKNSIPGDPFAVDGLGVIPLVSEAALDLPELDLLEQALDGGTLKITEVNEGGAVPFLRAENNGSKPVLILDGEELTGGKQNRIVNTTIIISAETSIKIPVSCVEARRWDYRRDDFEAGKALFRAKSRAVQKAGVAMSLRSEGSFRSDQGEVWREVDESLSELRVHSPTANFREGREQVSHRIEEFVERLRPLENQVGAVFFSPAGVLGAEVLGTWGLFAASLGKIIRSFAFNKRHIRGRQLIRAKSYAFLFFLLFLTVCPGSMVLAGEQKMVFATVRSCVYWIHQTDSNTVRSGRQRNPDHGPAHGLEKKGWECEKKKMKTLWHI